MKKGGFRLYYSLYFAAFFLATLLLLPYQFSIEEYIDNVLYAQLDFMLAFPLFMAAFVLIKLTAFMMLGNVVIAEFQSGNGIHLIRYKVIKYYVLQIMKVTGAVVMTTFGSVLGWCILTSSWSFSYLKIVSYIMLITSAVLLFNLLSLCMGLNFTSLFSVIFICVIGCFTVNAESQNNFLGIAALFYGITNAMLLWNIRRMNYL